MKYLTILLALCIFIPTNTFSQITKEKEPKQETLIDIQADKELSKYFSRAELFMMGNMEITEVKKQELIENAKKRLAQKETETIREKKYNESDLIVSVDFQNEDLSDCTSRGFSKMGWTSIGHFVKGKTGEEVSPKFEAKSNQTYPCKLSFISRSKSPIRLQFLSKDSAIKIPTKDLQIAPNDTVTFEFGYLVEEGYIEKIMKMQMIIEGITTQIEMPIGSLGFDLISHDFTSYRNLHEEPFVIDKNKTLHFVKKEQETVFSLYPFNTFEKPKVFEMNQEPVFAVAISGNYNQINFSQVPSGIYLARIIDFSQRNQIFRLFWIE